MHIIQIADMHIGSESNTSGGKENILGLVIKLKQMLVH